MRTLMNSKILLGAALTALTAACSATVPPKELADARTQYQMSAQGPAAAETPAQLHNAKVALDQAESSFAKDGDKPYVKDEAYVALREAQLADVMAPGPDREQGEGPGRSRRTEAPGEPASQRAVEPREDAGAARGREAGARRR